MIHPAAIFADKTKGELLLSDEVMQAISIGIYLQTIDCQIFLNEILPKSSEEWFEFLFKAEYRQDKSEKDYFKSPTKTILEGGDCEDLTTFVISAYLIPPRNPHLRIGFMVMMPFQYETGKTDIGHMVAVIDNGKNLAVIDLAMEENRHKILPFNIYMAVMKESDKLDIYRIWWMDLPNFLQDDIQIIK